MKTKFVYKQLDIEKAIRGKEEFLEDPKETIEVFKKKTVFDFVNDIRKFKKGDMLDDEQNHSIFNSYMILKILSMKENDIVICNFFNKYCSILTKEQLYFGLLHLIEKDNNFYKYINSKLDEVSEQCIESIAKYLKCSKREAKQYINCMGQDWALKVNDLYNEKEIK